MSSHAKHSALVVRQAEPYNAGTPPAWLRRQFITPTELFFARNHGTVPQLDAAAYRLHVSGLVKEPLSLSLDDLRSQFERVRITATLQCAGNRRQDLIDVRPIPGEVPWAADAIGTGEWAGARLCDVLQAAGISKEAKHVAFVGLDAVEREGRTFGFGGSIPLEKALSPEVLLAYELNGEPLPPLHGYPVRVLVPGYIGARSVKWLAEVRLQADPSENYFQVHAYRLFPPGTDAADADWESGLMLGELPVNAVICEPEAGERVPSGRVTVRGYALSGGRRVARVDVSVDGGETWTTASVREARGRWAWCFWEAEVVLGPGRQTIVARAVDEAANTQPEDPRGIWNFKGYMNNAWHRVTVEVGD